MSDGFEVKLVCVSVIREESASEARGNTCQRVDYINDDDGNSH